MASTAVRVKREGDNVFASPAKHCSDGKQLIRNDRRIARSGITEHIIRS